MISMLTSLKADSLDFGRASYVTSSCLCGVVAESFFVERVTSPSHGLSVRFINVLLFMFGCFQYFFCHGSGIMSFSNVGLSFVLDGLC